MGLNEAIDITLEQRKTILALLERHLPNTVAWVYGSRAKWTSRPQSDLDMVVFATPEQNRQVSDLREAFAESNQPFRVDLFVWDDVPEQFRKQIEAEHVVLVEKEEGITVDKWQETTLGTLLLFSNGKSSPGRSDGLPHPVYGSNGVIGFSDETNADPNTIVIGRVGSYCGSLNYSKKKCWVTDNAIRANPIHTNDAKFLFYLLQTLRLNDWRAGSGQPLLNQTILSSIPVTVPDPEKQRAIAHILGTLDDKIELNRRMNETLEEMARALFKSWFVDFLPVRAKMAAKQNNPSLLLPQAESGTWFVYAIECADGSLYIGQTENLRQRWLQHSSSKGGRWTKSHPPQRVAYWEKQPSRQAAVEREKWLKTGFGRKWRKKEIATRTQTGDPVRAKMAGRDTGLPSDVADLFPDRLVDSALGPIPEGWEIVPLPEILDFKEGPGIRNWQYTNSARGTRFINIRCIQGGDLLLSTANRIKTEEANGKYAHFQLKEWDIVVSTSGTLGRSAVVRRAHLPLLLNTSVIRFRPVDGATSFSYLHGYLNSPVFLDELTLRATGSVQRNFGPTHLKNIRMLYPPYNCIERYEDIAGTFLQLTIANRTHNDALTALRDGLLPKLVSGELQVEMSKNT